MLCDFPYRRHSFKIIELTTPCCPPHMIWILGGDKRNDVGDVIIMDSTEFITTDGAINGPKIPEGVSSSCAVKYTETEDVYLVGGFTGYTTSNPSGYTNQVWVANPSNEFTFTAGPSLITARYTHGCGTMSMGTHNILVVAGGLWYNSMLGYHVETASVEILDPLSNQQWVAGK